MIQIPLPGGSIELSCLLLDLNGTLTTDGRPLVGVASRVKALRGPLFIEIVSGDTFGTAQQIAEELALPLTRLTRAHQGAQKRDIVRRLGDECTAVIGNGNNDVAALLSAVLGICVVGAEGAAKSALLAADIVVPDPLSALDLLLIPKRTLATLRS